jgi:hypothetical protein
MEMDDLVMDRTLISISIYFILLTAVCIGYINYFLYCSLSSSKVS